MATTQAASQNMLFELGLQMLYCLLGLFFYTRLIYFRTRHFLSSLAVDTHRAPQLIRNDVAKLSKVPRHIAVALTRKGRHIEGGGMDGLLADVGELAVWCLGAGSLELTIYERTGVLKTLPLVDIQQAVSQRMRVYFGANLPSIRIVSRQRDESEEIGPEDASLLINLISESNGRKLIVDVSKALSDMVAQKQTTVGAITLNLVDEQLKGRVGSEPDLLILFSPEVDLQGYPPWHIRVTEIFCLPYHNGSVSYLVFLKALRKFANVKINLGR